MDWELSNKSVDRRGYTMSANAHNLAYESE